jgi:hypothetical protein
MGSWPFKRQETIYVYISRNEGLIGNTLGSNSDTVSGLLGVSFISLDYFPYFEKIKVSFWDHYAVCVSRYRPATFEYLKQTLWNLARVTAS